MVPGDVTRADVSGLVLRLRRLHVAAPTMGLCASSDTAALVVRRLDSEADTSGLAGSISGARQVNSVRQLEQVSEARGLSFTSVLF